MRALGLMVATLATSLLIAPDGFAGGNLAKQKSIEVHLDLGKNGGEMHRYYPNNLIFETGKLYKLVIHNPSNSKHDFTSPGLAANVYTRKVEVMDDFGEDAKPIGAIKGAIREIEVYPGGTTLWYFVPVATGTVEMSCGIKDKHGRTHAERGMRGTVTIR